MSTDTVSGLHASIAEILLDCMPVKSFSHANVMVLVMFFSSSNLKIAFTLLHCKSVNITNKDIIKEGALKPAQSPAACLKIYALAPLAAFLSKGAVAFREDKPTESWSSCKKNLKHSKVIHDMPLQATGRVNEKDTGISERIH